MSKMIKIPNELLTRGVEEVVVRKDLERKLASGDKLRIKHGVDPTTDKLHIGHAAVYWKLRAFQELGHTIVFLIGDFTARFGDPTDKAEKRKMRDKAEIDKAAETYLDQIKGILDLDKTEIRRNSEWYDKMSAEELLHLVSNFSVAQMLERDMFAARQKSGAQIGLHEPIYPVLQGYDSVQLKSDLTICGSDQLFNELAARPLQERAGQTPQNVMTVSLLIGNDGKNKMSQSLGNDIAITASPDEQFGRIMRVPDGLINHYFELATKTDISSLSKIKRGLETGELPARDAKLRLATDIVSLYHGDKESKRAREEFERVFSRKEQPSDIAEHKINATNRPLDRLLVELELAPSRSEAQRLIASGAVKIDGAVIGDWRSVVALHQDMVIQVGKKQFRKIQLG